MKRTAAVIVTYNRKAMLQRCLRALCTQTAGVPELWVIDNASTDGTAELVAQLNLPTMHYYNTGKNLGGAGGFACGIQQAACSGAEYLWIMDDDCLPEPDALQQLLLADAELDGQYGWLSSRALAPDGKDQPMNLQRSTPYKDLASFAGPRQPAVMASFVSLFLRSSTVQRFGLFRVHLGKAAAHRDERLWVQLARAPEGLAGLLVADRGDRAGIENIGVRSL